MKVRELITQLEKFDKDLDIGGCGHFGEILEINEVLLHEPYSIDGKKYIVIDIENAGDEPE